MTPGMFAVVLACALLAVFAAGWVCRGKSDAMHASTVWCGNCGDRLTPPRGVDPHRDRLSATRDVYEEEVS